MPQPQPIFHVAVPAPLHKCFDYLAPEGMALQPGMRVNVPFGRRQTVGVVTASSENPGVETDKLKQISEALDASPVVDRHWLDLCQWAADYYHHPVGEVMATALPAALRRGRPALYQPPRAWSLTDQGKQALAENKRLKRAIRQLAVMRYLADQAHPVIESVLCKATGQTPGLLKTLGEKGWLVASVASSDGIEAVKGPELNQAQDAAVRQILSTEGFQPTLLEGITGSGKTEIYLQTAAYMAGQGKQTLLLVPEIGLTPQLIQRFRERLGDTVAVLHSGLGDTERLHAWQQARHGDVAVIIGTRSSIFTPLASPGAILIDEEHDTSFKQQDGLRYSARDVAVRRAQMLDIPVVLGSATPSLETLQNSQQGRYQHARLPDRVGQAALPEIKTIDLRRQSMKDGLSDRLLDHMDAHLASGGQVMLFLNRRGYSPCLMCHHCGWVADCQRCDVELTYHRGPHRLRCHHCGSDRHAPRTCPECNQAEFMPQGVGTERVEAHLRERYPNTGIVRIDRDTTRRKNALTELLDEVSSQRARIIIGTQMLAKGHDFPDLSMVGILNADGGLFSIDFRAPERMAQLITQVAGRAGRSNRKGEVFLQTHHPDHPLLLGLISKGYGHFAQQALKERELAAYPPFGFLCLLRAEAQASDAPRKFLEKAVKLARPHAGEKTDIWEPVPAPMERRAGRYRYQLLIQSRQRAALHQLLDQLIPQLTDTPEARRVRWSVDVDPQDML